MTAGAARPGRVRFAVGVVVVLAAGLAAALAGRFGDDPRDIRSPILGQPAPAFSLPSLDDDVIVRLADHRGEVVVVNFWASWCVPCRQEHGELADVANRYRDLGVTVIGIAEQDTRADAQGFIAEFGSAYRMALDNEAVGIDYGLFGLPETFVINRAGEVAHKFTGPITAEELGDVLDEILAGR